MTLSSTAMVGFTHSEGGMTRFPPNVEQITVRRESAVTWLVVRRNDVRLEFPLSREDCEHLARLLLSGEAAALEINLDAPSGS
jgi:hypothetical protein